MLLLLVTVEGVVVVVVEALESLVVVVIKSFASVPVKLVRLRAIITSGAEPLSRRQLNSVLV